MLKSAIFAAALVCVASSAEARHRHPACVETGSILFPSCMGGDFLAGIRSIKVTMKRVSHVRNRHAKHHRNQSVAQDLPETTPNYARGYAPRPSRYIRGRLTCARNVNAALAERGIRGTRSALAHSFDHWGVRVPIPVVGAVAVTDRRGGGHVAIVSRVEGSRVFVFNPGRGGWTEREYTSRHARYRVAG